MDNTIHILLTATNSYTPFAAVTMVSIFENNKKEDFFIHIISEDFSDCNISKLKRICQKYSQQMEVLKPDLNKLQAIKKVLGETPCPYHISAYYRLLAIGYLPSNLNRIIYLDCDLIVIGQLRELWEKDLYNEDVALYAVPDLIRLNDYHRLRINNIQHIYFNSGVMLINLEYWRKQEVGQCCIDYIVSYPERISTADQDALNAVLAGKVCYLHPKYNTLSFFFAKEKYLSVRTWYNDMSAIREAIASPVIVHFATDKPWHKGAYLPYRNEWLGYLSMTEWKNMKLEYKDGLKGFIKMQIKKLAYSILGKLGNTLRLNYPVSPYQ